MKLEKAYSIELEKEITAQDADVHYANGSITSKHHFKCPDNNCESQIICTNLTRPKKLRKRDPYFKAIEKHSPDCEIGKAIRDSPTPTGEGDSPYGTDTPIEGAVRLNLTAPPVKRPKATSGGTSGGSSTGTGPGRGRDGNSDEERTVTPTKTVSSLVAAFLQNKEFDIELPGQESISLRDFFVPVNGQDLGDFVDEYRIYYGKAVFHSRLAGQGFLVRFENTLQHGELIKEPTFFISNESIQACSLSKFKFSELQKQADSNLRNVFILTNIAPFPNWSETYINFDLEALHYMDYRDE
ncbi:hypothetical protein [Alteromonas lipotrueiana]|uniref:hypothetical protein n=1 Tax=Alteromonas lipotrueiana TaxID=2803815 RepID=UPI001C46018E|nr:hypothetical protein [Alteromonas lipotrueiana]